MAGRSALVTVLFTDIVGSTQIAAEMGDRRWRELLARHHRMIRSDLRRFGGREIDTAGDGSFAAFDRPARPFAVPARSSRRCGSWGSRSGQGSMSARRR